MRYLGISTGIAGASLRCWRCGWPRQRGSRAARCAAAAPALVAASRDVVILLCGFGVLAGALSLMRTVPREARGCGRAPVGRVQAIDLAPLSRQPELT